MGKQQGDPRAVFVLAALFVAGACRFASAMQAETAPTPRFAIPENLVIDVRLFETRSSNPNRDDLRGLSFFIATDGRGVSANQWLATLSKKVPGAFLAALAFETARVEQKAAQARWALRSRALQIEIRLEDYHPAGRFQAQIETTFSRAGQPLRRFKRQVELQLRRTTAWSAEELEIAPSDYLSHFREYSDREARGLLYEELRDQSIFLLVTITPRLLSEDELPELAPEELRPPSDAPLPELDNPLGVPLRGTLVVGFEIGPSGSPVNPQIVSSSVPEANPRILGEASQWVFPALRGEPNRRRWGRVAVSVEIP